jgi:hypothetical protein
MEEILAALIINLLCTLIMSQSLKKKKKKKTPLYGRIGTTIDSRPG